MRDTAKQIIRNLLEENRCDGVLGLARTHSGTQPHLFERPDEVDHLTLSPKWLLAKEVVFLMKTLPPQFRLTVICRGCDQRALTELVKKKQVDGTRLHMLGLACDAVQAEACRCDRPFPDPVDLGTPVKGADPFKDPALQKFLTENINERNRAWRVAFQRCIKCYGCRNACPMCLCDACKLQNDLWSLTGSIPADPMGFHLIRAFHLADACVGCGACEDACPVDIPLRLLILPMQQSLDRAYGYRAGADPQRISPLLSAGPGQPAWTDSLEICP